MQVKDAMTRDVETAGIDTPISMIAEMMRSRDIGLLPVCDGSKLVGVLTDRDITPAQRRTISILSNCAVRTS